MAHVKSGSWEVVKALEEYQKKMEKWAQKGIEKTTFAIYNKAVALAPTDLGFLRESIDFKITNGGMKGVVSVGAEYSIFIEYGTGIYSMGPGGSRAKKIPWRYQDEDGEWHTTYGQHAQPFWNPAIDEGERVFRKYFS